MVCRFCGKEIEEGSVICNHCAKPVVNAYKNLTKDEYERLNEKDESIKNAKVINNQTLNNVSSPNENNSIRRKVLYVLSIILMVIGVILKEILRNDYLQYISYIIAGIGLVGLLKFKPVKNVKQKNLTPEEIEKNEIKLQEKREKSNRNSIIYAKISLWCNGIALIPTPFLVFCTFNAIGNVFAKSYVINIPEYYYEIAFLIAIPCIILQLIGICLGIVSNEIYHRNKISNIAVLVSVLIVLGWGAFLSIAFLAAMESCITSCPG